MATASGNINRSDRAVAHQSISVRDFQWCQRQSLRNDHNRVPVNVGNIDHIR
jgi:hypothetical protein